jgi:hypothetical protein
LAKYVAFHPFIYDVSAACALKEYCGDFRLKKNLIGCERRELSIGH